MSKLFKIVVKIVVKNTNGEIFFLVDEKNQFNLPTFDLDFTYLSYEDFLLRKFNLAHGQYTFISDRIIKKELYGEFVYYIVTTDKNLTVSEYFENGAFAELNKTNIDSLDKECIK